MARTRAQAQTEKEGKPTASSARNDVKPKARKRKEEPQNPASKKKILHSKEKIGDPGPKKRSLPQDANTSAAQKKRRTASPARKASKSPPQAEFLASKINRLIGEYGSVPLSDLGLKDPESPTSETILAHIFNALLSSGRIGHDIAHKTLQCLIDENYHDLETLKKSTWERRTEVLTDGGYTHYREKTATFLGDLAELIEQKYDGDAARLLTEEKGESKKVQKAVGKKLIEIKGLGPLGVEIFLGTIQTVYPSVAPFLGQRDLDAAKEIGLGSIENMWTAVGYRNKSMGMLTAALTKVRLEGRTGSFK